MIVVADGSKHVAKLGRFPLPIEVVPFGLTAVERSIARLLDSLGVSGSMALRRAADGAPYVTDGGHFILDAHLGRIDKPNVLASTLNNIPGVVEHGLFIGLATGAIFATGEGLVELGQIRP
jgi:ribose 5-phosphate isomerase A